MLRLRPARAAALAALLLAAGAAAGEPRAARGKTQAGCACLEAWTDAKGVTHAGGGCANPHNDPLGAGCAVDPKACLGYHSTLPGPNGSLVYYDYCGDVREATASGCLCAAEWRPDGAGKAAYRNRCAHPDSETVRKCKVDYATCPPNATVGAFDLCSPLPPAKAAAGAAAAGGAGGGATRGGCRCIEGGWWYLYPHGSAASGPKNLTIHGCANPDGDPVGQWCAVDPEKCDRFAGYVGLDPVNLWAFDYCGDAASDKSDAGDAARAAGPAAPVCQPWPIQEFGQCGGKSPNCTGWGCADEQWPGACCAEGLECRRGDAFYWQCVDPSRAAAAAAAAAEAAANATRASLGGPPPAPVAPGALPALEAGLPGLRAARPGQTIYVQLRLDYPFPTLERDVGAQARFKSDLVAFLKANAGDPKYVYSAGVDAILSGSVIANSHVVFTDDAPAELVADAPARLQERAAKLYHSSSMPSSWGPLLAVQSAVTRSALPEDDTATARAIPSHSDRNSGIPLGPGPIAGIVIGCAAVVGLAGFAVFHGLHRAIGKDKDKSAQLAYMNELTEADLEEQDELLTGNPAPKPRPLSRQGSLKRSAGGAAPGPKVWTWVGGSSGTDGGDANELRRLGVQLPQMLDSGPYAPQGAGAQQQSGGGASVRAAAGAGPEEAFLPVPDGEAAGRSTGGGAGIAFASLKQRRISSGSGGGPSPSGPAPRAHGSGAGSGGGSGYFGAALSRLGSTVASYVSGGGAPPEPVPGKDR